MSTYQTKKSLLVSFLAAASLLVASVAHADEIDDGKGFVELAVGQATPQGEDRWEDTFDSTMKLGLRGGVWARHGVGFELALDYTPLSSDEGSVGGLASTNWDWNRVRLMVGGRGGANVSRRVKVFARLLLGADYVSLSGEYMVLGFSRSHEESDIGLAAEIGGGVVFNVFGAFSVGAQVAVPMAFHGTEADASEERYFDYDYNAYDLDLMLTVASAF